MKVILLGNAQDAGLPQTGCRCANCLSAWATPSQRRAVCALGLLDTQAGQWFIIDATPDFREQFHFMQTLAGNAQFAGLLITHAHMGHYTGLIHLGFEAMAASRVPVYGTRTLINFLASQAPWQQLVEHENIVLKEVFPNEPLLLSPSLVVHPLLVPHRAEWSDTLGFIIQGPAHHLLYLPDTDGWNSWTPPIQDVVAAVQTALIDGTFFDTGEIPDRDVSEIGHPLVVDSVARLKEHASKVHFIHLNHSNPLHRPGPQRNWLHQHGFKIGAPGDVWEL